MKKILLSLLILVVAIAGCQQASDDGGDVTNPFIGGSQGVVAEFEVMGSPSNGGEEIFEGENFPVEVNIKNKGEYAIDQNGLAVILRGIPVSDFTGLADSVLLEGDEGLEGISEFNPQGGEVILSFAQGAENPVYNVDITGSQFPINFVADVIYDYETQVIAPQICFKEDLQDTTICEVDGSKEVFSSGAPVRVTSASQARAGSGRIQVDFVVQNVGSGQVQGPDEEFDATRNFVGFEMQTQPEEWDCKAGGSSTKARLDNGMATIRCRLINELPADTLFTQPVNMVLKYQYKERIAKTLLVRSNE